jgi:ribonucleoside-diphosphate reductase alpha chain
MDMNKITVIKRNGTKEPLNLEKWQHQIAKVCSGIADVSQSMIEIESQPHYYDGITTKEIDEITLRAIVNLIDIEANPDIGHTNYQFVAGKQRLSMLRKDVYGQYQPPNLYDIVKKNIEIGLYTPELLDWYSEDEWNKMDSFIDHDKDEQYSYAAIEQLIEKYLLRNRATKEVYETPQVRYMVAAATVFHKEEPNSARMKYIKEYYNAASDGLFTLATPVLAGLGTPTKQFSSCVLIRSDDDLDSIFASGEMMAKYASKRAGIGLEVGRLRPLGSPIRNGEIMHTGFIPFLKKWFGDLRSCSQGGVRNASATVFYPIWHYQFDDLIVLKNNQGTEETRVRHMDYGVVLSAFFWRRFKDKGNITFFDPNEVPDLYEAFYQNTTKFEELYVKYEKRKDLRKKTMSAEEVFKGGILKERTDTGRIYLVFIDNVMKQGPFDPEHHTIYQSNLCLEINLPTVPLKSLDDEGEFKLSLDDGTEVLIPGQHKVLLSNGDMKKVRELTEDDDITDLLL